MKRLIQAVLLAFALFACGDYPEKGSSDGIMEEAGERETGVYANTGYGWQFGTGSASKCTSSNTQECYVPNNKYVHIWIDGTSMTATEKTRAANGLTWWIQELDTMLDHAGWNYVYNNSNTSQADVRVVAGASGISQTPNGNLRKDYVKITCDNPGPVMSEDIVGAPGQYRFCNRLRATVNFANTDSKAAQMGIPAASLLTDTMGFIAAVAGGHGAINTTAPVLNALSILPVDKYDVLSTNNVCYAETYDPSDPTTITVLTISCNP